MVRKEKRSKLRRELKLAGISNKPNPGQTEEEWYQAFIGIKAILNPCRAGACTNVVQHTSMQRFILK